jgi:hypothetical protein
VFVAEVSSLLVVTGNDSTIVDSMMIGSLLAQSYAAVLALPGPRSWTSTNSSKMERYWIIALRSSSVVAALPPVRVAIACARRYLSMTRG